MFFTWIVFLAFYCILQTTLYFGSITREMFGDIVIRRAAYRSLFVGREQEEIQEDFVDQRVFDHLLSVTDKDLVGKSGY